MRKQPEFEFNPPQELLRYGENGFLDELSDALTDGELTTRQARRLCRERGWYLVCVHWEVADGKRRACPSVYPLHALPPL